MTPHPYAPRDVDQSRFGDQPELMIWQARKDSLAIPPGDIAKIQLAGLNNRFEHLAQKIPVLRKLADEQGISRITRIEDGAALLFKHSVYKSYPFALIEKNRFDRLTAWLDNLTVHDLSGFSASGLESIDDWLDRLYETTPVRIIHSTGTTGKLSFLPRGKVDTEFSPRSFILHFEENGVVPDMSTIPMIVPGHRRGFSAYNVNIDQVAEKFYNGDESMLFTLFPGRISADLLSLGGRLKAAESKGELGSAQIPAALLARRDQLAKEQGAMAEQRKQFFQGLTRTLRGRRIALTGNWVMLYDIAKEGLESGAEDVFARDGLLITAGGTKGKVLPSDHKAVIEQFLGFGRFQEGYGFSEVPGGLFPRCEKGHYHAPPWYILYLLDPRTGEALPRTGTHTGRLGVVDLLAQTQWAGVLSGDEVTVTWDKPCACGATGAYLGAGIRRYSEKEGGDDKITCAGAPEAHDNALAFLAEFA